VKPRETKKYRIVSPWMAILITLLAGVAVLPLARAQTFLDCTSLLAECQRENDMVCIGYVLGVADAILTTDRLAAPPARRDVPGSIAVQRDVKLSYCLPEGLGMSDLKASVVKFLTDNTAQLRRTASSLVRGALVAEYPCKRE